ncbi:MAG: hypothetical protein ACE364_09230 [Chlorobiota bacterium]
MKNISLINSSFEPKDAKQVLLSLLDYKIQFHNQKILSSFEKYGKEDEYSKNRIGQLKQEREKVLEMFNYNDFDGCTIALEAEVSIKVLENA